MATQPARKPRCRKPGIQPGAWRPAPDGQAWHCRRQKRWGRV